MRASSHTVFNHFLKLHMIHLYEGKLCTCEFHWDLIQTTRVMGLDISYSVYRQYILQILLQFSANFTDTLQAGAAWPSG